MFSSLLRKFKSNNDKAQSFKKAVPLIINDPKDTEDFYIDYVDPCYCGSNKYFKSCCGLIGDQNKAPYGIFVYENYLSKEKINEILEIAVLSPAEHLKVIEKLGSSSDKIVTRDDELRVSERIILGDYYPRLVRIINTAFQDLVAKSFAREIEWFEPPSLLRYQPGGFYYSHADSENMNFNTGYWNKVIDRDISLLLYLNDDFSGGDLLFNKLNYRIRPKPGMAVLFPSDHRFMHEAMPVTRGVRYAIVSWASVQGVNKVQQQPGANIIYPSS